MEGFRKTRKETKMANDKFTYVTFIRTTAAKLWEALTKPEFTRQYWYGVTHESSWEEGAPWRMLAPDGRVTDSGKILEVVPPKRLVLSWQHELMPEMKGEGLSRASFDLEQQGEAVKLTLNHEIGKQGTKLMEGLAQGWPAILSSLKSLLETGQSLKETREWPKGMDEPQKRMADMPKTA